MKKTNALTLEFNVDGQKIYYDEKNKTVADSRQYLYTAFYFSDEWKSPKFALFSAEINTENPIVVQLDENDGCYAPSEIIKAPGFYVSVYCAYGERLITADKRQVSVSPSGYSNKSVPPVPEGPEEPENPGGESVSVSILDRILAEAEEINRYLYTAQTVGDFDTAYETAQSAVNGSLPEQQEALADLREAIDGLTQASFSFASGNIIMTKNKDYPAAQYVVYDGIGTVTGYSENTALFTVINNGLTFHAVTTGVGYARFYAEEALALTGAEYLRKIVNITN